VTRLTITTRSTVLLMTAHQPLRATLLQRSASTTVPFRAPPRPEARNAAHHTPTPPPPEMNEPRSPGSVRRPLTRAIAWGLAAAIPTVIVIGTVVEPIPNGPEPVLPLWVDLLGFATILAALASLVALVAVQRAGVWLAAATSGGLLALTVTCPMSGHHLTGSHTYVQFGLSSALLATSALVLATRGPASRMG
jgi:hypothetical protein